MKIQEIKKISILSYIQENHVCKTKKAGSCISINPCPICGHNDSFRIDKENRWHCYSECNTGGDLIDLVKAWKHMDDKQAIEHIGGEPMPTKQQKLTVADLAQHKMIPLEFLQKTCKIKQNGHGVIFGYFKQDGNPARNRIRHGISGHDVRWTTDHKPIVPYGIWHLREKPYPFLWLVEGESDSWTLWYNKIPAIGIPGANMSKLIDLAHVANAKEIYISHEPDKAGDEFVKSITDRLTQVGYKGKAYPVRMPDGCKDPSDLWCKLRDKDKFAQSLLGAIEQVKDEQDLDEQIKQLERANFEETLKTKEFPVWALPDLLQRYVISASEAISIPNEAVALPLLTSIGACIGNTKEFEVKKGWIERPSLYTAVIAAPGIGKSAAISAGTRFLHSIEAGYQVENDSIEQIFEQETLEYEMNVAEWKQARKSGITDMPTPTRPTRQGYKRLITSDFTVEAIAEIINNNPRSLIVEKDELMGLFNSLNQYKGGHGSDRQFWLSAWSGQDAPVDRKNKKPLLLKKLCVCITGAMPEKEIANLPKLGDGFIDRFIFACPKVGAQPWTEKEVDDQTINDMQSLFNKLRLDTTQRTLTMGKAAKDAFTKWYNALDAAKLDMPQELKEPASKMPRQAARLALILELAENPESIEISEVSIASAISICEWALEQFKVVLGVIFESQEEKNLRKIIEFGKKKGLTQISARDIVRAKLVKTAEIAKHIFEFAEKQGYCVEKKKLCLEKQ